jgi:hypothetical protein
VFVRRDGDQGFAIEVHHAHPNEVTAMIDKKRWAEIVMARCTKIKVTHWIWVASPPNGEILFLRQSPIARRLAERRSSSPGSSVSCHDRRWLIWNRLRRPDWTGGASRLQQRAAAPGPLSVDFFTDRGGRSPHS